MKDDELEETSHEASEQRYRERAEEFIESDTARRERAAEGDRRARVEDDWLLRDEDDAKVQLPVK